jgi:hypothetical protein
MIGTVRAGEPAPDPRALLHGVAVERMSVLSGKMDLKTTLRFLKRPQDGPAITRVTLRFDGEKRRADEQHTFLMVDWLRAEPGQAMMAKRNRLLDLMGSQEAVVAAGLGYWREIHVRLIYDGKQVFRTGQSQVTSIRDPKTGFQGYLIDPRVLGLAPLFSVTLRDNLDRYLVPTAGDSVTVIGRETIDGSSSWHVLISGSVQSNRGGKLERHLWIEPPPGHRVFKYEVRNPIGRTEVVSEYGPPESDRRLPFRTRSRRFDPAGAADMELVVERTNTVFGVPFDPGTWTLAGLELPVGEPVMGVDRVVRFWDGKALCENLVPRLEAKSDEP